MENNPVVKPLITPAENRAEPLDVGGLNITVLASKTDTGIYEIFHAEGAEGKGPGPHYHPWHESIIVTRGEMHCGVGQKEFVAAAGTLIHIPGDTVHWFSFGRGGGEFISMTSDGNASAMFTAFSKGINWESPDREELVKLAAAYGQVIVN
jgi:quercetin dioxygenase-like cupin family protein